MQYFLICNIFTVGTQTRDLTVTEVEIKKFPCSIYKFSTWKYGNDSRIMKKSSFFSDMNKAKSPNFIFTCIVLKQKKKVWQPEMFIGRGHVNKPHATASFLRTQQLLSYLRNSPSVMNPKYSTSLSQAATVSCSKPRECRLHHHSVIL